MLREMRHMVYLVLNNFLYQDPTNQFKVQKINLIRLVNLKLKIALNYLIGSLLKRVADANLGSDML